MVILETLALGLGATIAKTILSQWLQDNGVAKTIGTGLIDVIKTVVPEGLAQRRGQRQFEAIADRIAEDLTPLFERSGLSEDRQGAIAWLAEEAIEAAQINAELLVAKNVDPVELAHYLIEAQPKDPHGFGFSEFELQLYRRVIDRSAVYIVDIASQLPQFTEHSVAEILSRESQLIELAQRIIEEMPPYRDAGQFDADYRTVVGHNLDNVELFGVTLGNNNRRQRLSVAYVSLSATPGSSLERQQITDASDFEKLPGDAIEDTDTHGEHQPESGRIEELLTRGRRLIIRGDAGTGKTTLLRWIAVRSANQDFPDQLQDWNRTIPFFIPLRRFVDKEFPQPEQFPSLVAPARAGLMPQGWVHSHLDSGDAVVLIDGVDELPQSKRVALRAWLEDLTETFGNARFIVTSRPSAIEEDWMEERGFAECEVQPMDLPDILRFIERWHAAIKESLRSDQEKEKEELEGFENNLVEIINASRSIRNLASNPLLCAVICALHRDRHQQLPSDRIQLYEACCEMLLERRETEQGIHLGDRDYPTLTYREKRALLEDLSLWMMRNSHSTVGTGAIDERFNGKLANMPGIAAGVTGAAVRSFLVARSGMIREPVAGEIDFTHRTFQEFLAAQAAIDEQDIGFLVNKSIDDQWRETVILASGLAGLKAREDLIRGILRRGDEEPNQRHQLHLLAVACLETSVELGPELRQEVASRLSNLVPPRNLTEAKALSSAGELAVPFLNYDSGLNAARAAACVRALALIGGEAALNALKGYSGDRRQSVIKQLLRAEESFDFQVYSQDVLKNLAVQRLSLQELFRYKDAGLVDVWTKLNSLDLMHNNLTSIPPEVFQLTNLRHLDLRHNQLTCLAPEVIQFTNLRILELEGNRLTALPPEFLQLTTLSYLDLGHNRLNSIPPQVFELTMLQHLDLGFNQLTSLPAEIGQLTSLRYLTLAGNQLSSLPPEVFQLISLQSLSLAGNQLASLPAEIGLLTNLRQLYLWDCQLKSLPPEVFQLPSLLALHLGNNQLTSLPPEIGQLTNLRDLSLGNNELTSLPPEIGQLTNLRSLYLPDNKVATLPPEIGQLTNLRYLTLAGNQITYLPPEIERLTNLQILRLQR